MIKTKNLFPIFNGKEYVDKWDELEARMMKEGFMWTALWENEEWNQYMSFSLFEMDKRLWNSIQEATEKIGFIFQKTYELLLTHDDLFNQLSIPPRLKKMARGKSTLFSYFSRMDLIVNGEDIRVIEVNSDTPVGYLESSVGNRIICEQYGVSSPNNLEVSIQQAWDQLKKEYEISENDMVYFTSYDEHDEDMNTMLFSMKQFSHPHKEYIVFEDINVNEDGLFDQTGNPITYLVRMIPLEYLLKERKGELFLQHVENGVVKLINPPSAFLMQSKEIMALIWSLYEKNSLLYSNMEKEWIKQYFLPTYWNGDVFLEKQIPYVSKPMYGREGGGISIHENGEVYKDQSGYYRKQQKIYQQYVKMPDVSLDTWNGTYKGKLLIGSHLIAGKPSGLFLRAGEKITGNLSMFFGVSIEERKRD